MILYGMWSGGTARCSGTTKTGQRCKNRGYTFDLSYGFWCHLHIGQST